MRQPVSEWFTLGEQADQAELALPAGFRVADEIAFRQERLEHLAKAKAVLAARAQERDAAEQAADDAQVREREATARENKRLPRARTPKPPQPGPRAGDQYNFTDPDSRIMKNSSDEGFDQHYPVPRAARACRRMPAAQGYNAPVAVDPASLFVVAPTGSHHPNDQHELEPTVDAISPRLGTPEAAALDHGYWSAAQVQALEDRQTAKRSPCGIEPLAEWVCATTGTPAARGQRPAADGV